MLILWQSGLALTNRGLDHAWTNNNWMCLFYKWAIFYDESDRSNIELAHI